MILLVTSSANLDTSCVRRKNLIKLTRLAWFSKDLRYMKNPFKCLGIKKEEEIKKERK